MTNALKMTLKSPLELGPKLLTPLQVHRRADCEQITAAQAIAIAHVAKRSRKRRPEVKSFQKNRKSLVPPRRAGSPEMLAVGWRSNDRGRHTPSPTLRGRAHDGARDAAPTWLQVV